MHNSSYQDAYETKPSIQSREIGQRRPLGELCEQAPWRKESKHRGPASELPHSLMIACKRIWSQIPLYGFQSAKSLQIAYSFAVLCATALFLWSFLYPAWGRALGVPWIIYSAGVRTRSLLACALCLYLYGAGLVFSCTAARREPAPLSRYQIVAPRQPRATPAHFRQRAPV